MAARKKPKSYRRLGLPPPTPSPPSPRDPSYVDWLVWAGDFRDQNWVWRLHENIARSKTGDYDHVDLGGES
jgi:hypothetical protein